MILSSINSQQSVCKRKHFRHRRSGTAAITSLVVVTLMLVSSQPSNAESRYNYGKQSYDSLGVTTANNKNISLSTAQTTTHEAHRTSRPTRTKYDECPTLCIVTVSSDQLRWLPTWRYGLQINVFVLVSDYDEPPNSVLKTCCLSAKNEMSQYRAYFVPGAMDPLGLSSNERSFWESHHWFVQQFLNEIKKACGNFDIDEYATHVHGNEVGGEHHFLHHMGQYDFNDLNAGSTRGGFKGLNYNNAVQETINRANGNCCDLINGMIGLIDSYWTLLNYYRMETIGPQAYSGLQIYSYGGTLKDKDGFTQLLQYQEAVCKGRRRPNDNLFPSGRPMSPPVIRIPVEGGKEHEIHLKYSPYYRNLQYRRQMSGSWNARSEGDIVREAQRLRRQLDWGLMPKTVDEIQSEYTNEAIDRVVPGSLNRSRASRESSLRSRINRQQIQRCRRPAKR